MKRSERKNKRGSFIDRKHERCGRKDKRRRERRETDEMREIKRGKTRQGGSGETPIKAQIR